MTQKTRGLITATVEIQNGKIELLEKAVEHLAKQRSTNVISHKVVNIGKANQNSVIVHLQYGPVWGGWESDVRKHVTNAAVKAGTKATVTVKKLKRDIVAYR